MTPPPHDQDPVDADRRAAVFDSFLDLLGRLEEATDHVAVE
jgi:hypothetical protein